MSTRCEFVVEAGCLSRGSVRPAVQYAADKHRVEAKIYEDKGFIDSVFTIVIEGEQDSALAAVAEIRRRLEDG